MSSFSDTTVPLRFAHAHPSLTSPTKLYRPYLLPQARGTGASEALMEQCLETGRRIGADVLWLQVNDRNERANAFYERAGLQRVGTATFRLGAQVHSDFLRAARL